MANNAIVTILKKETGKNCEWMHHYTFVYRGREYVETLTNEFRDMYNEGDKVLADTYKYKGTLMFFLKSVVN